nr:LON peptidase substrate-binding domain-containing protein [Chitinasiproducens palmae]
MAETLQDLPLFPLGTVLFPDGLLPLRVFEARYLDMTRECLREAKPFGVCLIREGAEVAQAGVDVVPETVGCLAEIIDCDMQHLGVLLLRTRGTHRFHLNAWRTGADGLLRGDGKLVPADPPVDDPADLHCLPPCAAVLRRIVETLGERDTNLPFLEPFHFDDPCWVGNRLAEVLPLPLGARQKLMALEHAGARLRLVHQFMEKHQLL